MNTQFKLAPRMFALLASLMLAVPLVAQDHLIPITSQSSQGANDSLTWSQLGADGTLLTASLSARSVNGLAVTGSLAGPNSVPSVVCSATVCSWTGTGFPAGDTLIWTSDAANGGNGPLTLTFANGIGGGGALIQADSPGQFTAQIQAYNASTLLGTFTVTSDANGNPAYIGVLDQTAANITSLTFSLTNCADTCTDFAIDTAYLSGSGTSNTFPLTVAVSGSGSGTVTSTPAGISCPGTCTANFSSGTSVTLTETLGANSTFSGWSGACTGTGACTVSMTAAQSVTANFQGGTQQFPLTVTVSGSGSGTVTSTPAAISCPGTCTANFNSGTSVTLTETVGANSTFNGWSGACTGTGACTVSMTAAQSVTATFQQPTKTNTTLTVSSAQANVGSSVTFTAKVAPMSGNTTPTGTVTFNNGSTGLGAIQLVSGTATLTTNSLPAGSYSVTAAYSGDPNSASSSSAAVALIVGDMNVTASPTSLTVPAGQTASTTLTVTPTPLTGFSPTVTFSCSGLPAQATCTFTPTSVTSSGAAVTTTLSIQTAAGSNCALPASVSGQGSGWIYLLLLPGLIGVFSLKKKQLVLSARFLGVFAVLAMVTMSWTACSTKIPGCTGGSNSGTPTGTSTITVTAATSGSNPISKQITIALTVQ